MKRTKIVATIGPASEKTSVLRELIRAGVDVVRFNFSHGDYSWHKKVIERIRLVEKITRKRIAIMADIQGPRIRTANKKKIKLKSKEKVFLTDLEHSRTHRYKKEILLDWKGFFQHLRRGDLVYIEDGLIQLKIVKKYKDGAVAEVVEGGEVGFHKGVNIPTISHHLGFLTPKDIQDIEFILSQDVDAIAVSFVSNGKDLRNLKEVMGRFIVKNSSNSKEKERKLNKKKTADFPWIISKIERKDAVLNIEDIIKESDGIMVARGDLAIEAPQEKVTIFQKNIIKQCLRLKKPSIVATQMMASMVKNARPTRAEISDVTNAVIDQADAIMFSNETAVGVDPVKVVRTAVRIIEETEKSPLNDMPLKRLGRLAKKLLGVSTDKKREVKASNFQEMLEVSSLRQENVSIKFLPKSKKEKRKAAFVWGAA